MFLPKAASHAAASCWETFQARCCRCFGHAWWSADDGDITLAKWVPQGWLMMPNLFLMAVAALSPNEPIHRETTSSHPLLPAAIDCCQLQLIFCPSSSASDPFESLPTLSVEGTSWATPRCKFLVVKL